MGLPLIPLRTPVLASGPPDRRTRMRLRGGATCSRVPITSTWKSSTRVPSKTVLPIPFIPVLISLNGMMSWAMRGAQTRSGRKDQATRDKRFIRNRIIAQRRRTDRRAVRLGHRASHARRLRNAHEVEGAAHLGQKKIGENHARLLPARVGLLHDGIFVVKRVESLRQIEEIGRASCRER